jgi:hypothetical protein
LADARGGERLHRADHGGEIVGSSHLAAQALERVTHAFSAFG